MREQQQRRPLQNLKSRLQISLRTADVDDFVSWLEAQNKKKSIIKRIKNYAVRYTHILDTGNASELMTLSTRNRCHAMQDLSAYFKYLGCYDNRWQESRKSYSLK